MMGLYLLQVICVICQTSLVHLVNDPVSLNGRRYRQINSLFGWTVEQVPLAEPGAPPGHVPSMGPKWFLLKRAQWAWHPQREILDPPLSTALVY